MRIAFYAPLKPPTHPVASGDRQVARLLMTALARNGHDVFLVSELRSYLRVGGDADEERLRDEARAERERIRDAINTGALKPPDLWFSYHPYYKSPDWLGPPLCKQLGIPYVTAEASYAGKREQGDWANAQNDVRAGLKQAAINFHMTLRDREGLEKAIGHGETLHHLPPFIDVSDIKSHTTRGDGPVRLLTVAMMRDDVKLRSYEFLADAIAALTTDKLWQLDIAGDGEARATVEAAFAKVVNVKPIYHGALDEAQLRARYEAADVFVWPGFEEAYGMAFLEAQAHGLPVIALDSGGVSEVVRDGVSGRLVHCDDAQAFASALAHLIENVDERERLARGAASYVRAKHSLDAAAARLDETLRGLVSNG